MEPSSTTPPPPVPSQGRAHHPQLHAQIPNSSTTSLQHWTASSTPMSSPGLFSPTNPRAKMSLPVHAATDCNTPTGELNSPFLHPLQNHKVRETHKALVDLDFLTGRKLINQYEVIEEIGRGVHGKVKLARNTGSGENVAIKIIPRFSKKRRLGKVMALSPQDKTKREIAILKKIRHPNVVALLEVIDDPELKKIYMVLEHVELGEVVWRKKGLPHICAYERRRVEKEMRGEIASAEEETYDRLLGQRQGLKDLKRAKMSQSSAGPTDFWSIEYGAAEDDDSESRSRISSKDNLAALEGPSSTQASRATSRAPSRTHSVRSVRSWGLTAHHIDNEHWNAESGSEIDTPGPLRSGPGSSAALDGTMYGPYVDDGAFRGRSPSMADSIISHMSSIDYSSLTQDPYQDDYSYVPCFTFEQARTTFRDTVLGLEYLHYQGVVHRDIKPANLLWTKDHRVKISDFGVSYFGRPIRDSEAEDGMSESEALDFDDDLELSKTVGTPAFFAPELCYTDMDWEQPRISEQIDVWSLGVTLYCLIFARIPFIAADEFQMFKKIATEDVYLPTRRLRPVDPSTPPNSTSLFKRQNKDPYRDDNALEYEDIPPALHDLLKKMLVKNPEKRIRLRDIKRHPWVTEGIDNLIGWLDDTDPARPSSGRRIQVNEKEMSHAVVPITFLERARSAMKKAVGKVIHPLGERAESKSRRRAASSVASSAGDSMQNGPHTPHPRDARRRSLRGDDYFTGLTSEHHPLTQSLVPSPVEGEFPRADPMATAILRPLSMTADFQLRSKEADRSDGRATDADALPSPQPLRPFQRHSHARSMGHHTFLPLTPSMPESQTMPPTPSYDGAMDDPHDAIRKSRDMQASSDDGRARSVDRGLFGSTDKRAQPKVGLSTAVAPGNVAVPKHKRTIQSIDLSKASAKVTEGGLPSPLLFSHRAISGYQHAYPNSDPNIHHRQQRVSSELDERPQTAHRVETVTDPRVLPVRSEKSATPDFFFRGKRMSFHHREDDPRPASRSAVVNPADVPCPPSPADEGFPAQPQPPSREDTIGTGKSNSLASFAGLETPLTSPSEVTSPISTQGFAGSKANSQQMLAFQSDPSLPALLSGASSVSNDMESELLGQPGIVSTRTALLETTDSLTPPAMTKEPIAGYPLEQALEATSSMDSGIVPLELDQYSAQAAHQKSLLRSPDPRAPADEDEDDSDSDGGLQMVKTKRKKMPLDTHGGHRTLFTARRRDTNASIGSTETAKKVGMQGE